MTGARGGRGTEAGGQRVGCLQVWRGRLVGCQAETNERSLMSKQQAESHHLRELQVTPAWSQQRRGSRGSQRSRSVGWSLPVQVGETGPGPKKVSPGPPGGFLLTPFPS
jgi:hypothetical protein